MRYIYCPQCGKKLIGREAGDDGMIPYCEACEKYWFDSFASCVITMVINEEEEIVLIGQKYMSEQYKNFISGFMSPGENAEEAARREVKEEIGLDLERLEASGTWWYEQGDMLMHGYVGYVKKQPLTPSDTEVDSAEWVPLDQVEPQIWPDSPGNAQFGTYKWYLEQKSKK